MKTLTFELNCPACDKRLRCPPELVGRNSTCPKCQSPFYISPPRAVAIETASQAVAESPSNWAFDETVKSIDDSIVRVAKVSATNSTGIVPKLCFRTTLQRRRVLWELYCIFPQKAFSIREPLLQARVRIDQNKPLSIPISPSQTGDACFLGETWDILNQMQNGNTLYCELAIMKTGTETFEFPVAGFAEIHRRMLQGAVATTWTALQEFNRDIVEHVLRIGPKNLDALIEALSRTKLLSPEQLSSAAEKSTALFSAAQEFGKKHHVYEIYGALTGNKPNDPFAIAVLNNLSLQTRDMAGKLYIMD